MNRIEDETYEQDGWSVHMPEDGNRPVTITRISDGQQRVLYGMEASSFRHRFTTIIKINSLPTLCQAVFDQPDGEVYDKGTDSAGAGGTCQP